MRTLYLHIGLPKTASTAIQRFCESNKEKLNAQGYSYPAFDYKYDHVESRRNGHFLVGVCKDRQGKRELEKEEALRQKGLEMVEKEFQSYDSVILSDENIWHGTIKRKTKTWDIIKEHSEKVGYQVRIILYLRRQDDLAVSWLNQQVKAGWSRYNECNWQKFLENPQYIALDYATHIQDIADVLGEDAICIRVFDRTQFVGGSIQADFVDAIGLSTEQQYVIEQDRSNVALTCNEMEIKRIINGLPDHDKETYAFVRDISMQRGGVALRSDPYDYLSVEDREDFLKKYEEGNQNIAKKYLGREDGKLFSEVKSSKEPWTPDNPHMQEDIVRFLGEIILVQQKEIKELKKNQEQMQKDMKEIKKQQNQSYTNKVRNFKQKLKKK